MNENIIAEIKRFHEISGNKINEGIIDDVIGYLGNAVKNVSKEDIIKFIDTYFPDAKENVAKALEKTGNVEKPIQGIDTSDDGFYGAILDCLDAPKTENNMTFLYAWRQSEGAKARYNPFNTTMPMGDSTFYNCLRRGSTGKCQIGVRNYSTREDGINATCKTLKLRHYSKLLSQLRQGDVPASELAANSKELKTWGTGELVAKVVASYERGAKPSPPPIATA